MRLNRRKDARQHGFTLIEAALTVVIIGTGVLAIVAAQQAYHMKNDWAQRTATAQVLANEVRERMFNMSHHDPMNRDNLGPETNEGDDPDDVANWDDLDDFAGQISGGLGAGVTFNPPINALGMEMEGLDQWTQHVSVENVSPDNLAIEDSDFPLGSTEMMRVSVTVTYRQDEEAAKETMTTLTWVSPR